MDVGKEASHASVPDQNAIGPDPSGQLGPSGFSIVRTPRRTTRLAC